MLGKYPHNGLRGIIAVKTPQEKNKNTGREDIQVTKLINVLFVCECRQLTVTQTTAATRKQR